MLLTALFTPARAAKTHRELFSEWYEDLMGEPLAAAMAADPQPAASKLLFDQMMRDIAGGGGCADPMGQVSALRSSCSAPCSSAFLDSTTSHDGQKALEVLHCCRYARCVCMHHA